MTSSTAQVRREVDKIGDELSVLSKDVERLEQENAELHEEKADRNRLLKTTRIVKEKIITDPETNEIRTESEVTTYFEEDEGNWIVAHARNIWARLNPITGKQTPVARVVKTLVVSLLMMGTVYAFWKGLKGVGIVRGNWATKIENVAWGVYRRIPFLPYAVGSVKGFISGLFGRSISTKPITIDADHPEFPRREL